MKNLIFNVKESLKSENVKLYLIISGIYLSLFVFLAGLSVAAAKIATIYLK